MANNLVPTREAETLLGEKRQLAGLETDLPSMADKLREALTSRLEHPLMGQRAEAIGQFFEAGPRARQEAVGLLGAPGVPARPTAVENLVAQRRAAALTPVLGLTGLIGAKLGGIEDIIEKGTSAFQSLVGAQRGRVELAQTAYDLALKELVEKAKREQEDWEKEWAIKQITGGKVTLPSGQVIEIPSETARKLAGQAERAGTVVQTGEGVFLIDPYTGKTIKRIGSAKAGAQAGQTLIAKVGRDVIGEINKLPEEVRNETGTTKAFGIVTKLEAPFGLGRFFLAENERSLADLESKYFSLTKDIITVLEGKRPSDYDAKAYQMNIGPSIRFPRGVNEDRIKNLETILQSAVPSAGNEWEVIDLGE